jgi:hypothetical protein
MPSPKEQLRLSPRAYGRYCAAEPIQPPALRQKPPKKLKGLGTQQEGLSGLSKRVSRLSAEMIMSYEIEPEADVPRPDRSHVNHLEGPSIPRTTAKNPKSAFKTTVNNTGAFHDSNISHINQGDYSTVAQGNHIFNIRGNTVHVNEDGLSGAVRSCS